MKIEQGTIEKVLFSGRYIVVITQDKSRENIKKLLDVWYKERAAIKFPEIAEPLIQRFEEYKVTPKSMHIRQMKLRWGSCSANGNIILNPELIKAPKACIRSEEHTSELQSRGHLVCRLLLEKKKSNTIIR